MGGNSVHRALLAPRVCALPEADTDASCTPTPTDAYIGVAPFAPMRHAAATHTDSHVSLAVIFLGFVVFKSTVTTGYAFARMIRQMDEARARRATEAKPRRKPVFSPEQAQQLITQLRNSADVIQAGVCVRILTDRMTALAAFFGERDTTERLCAKLPTFAEDLGRVAPRHPTFDELSGLDATVRSFVCDEYDRFAKTRRCCGGKVPSGECGYMNVPMANRVAMAVRMVEVDMLALQREVSRGARLLEKRKRGTALLAEEAALDHILEEGGDLKQRYAMRHHMKLAYSQRHRDREPAAR